MDIEKKEHETRELKYSIPKGKISKLRAVAYYDLLSPSMKKKLPKPEDKDLITSKIITVSESTML